MYENKCFISQWLRFVRAILDNSGMSFMYIDNNANYDFNWFKAATSMKINDCFIQEWSSALNNSESMIIYRLFKHRFLFENYLITLPKILADIMLKYRTRNMFLPVASFNTPNTDKMCFYCDEIHADEYHYLTECNYFNNDRKNIINKRYVTNIVQFKNIMQCKNSVLKLSILMCKILNVLNEMYRSTS
jgi:hypothetical protein